MSIGKVIRTMRLWLFLVFACGPALTAAQIVRPAPPANVREWLAWCDANWDRCRSRLLDDIDIYIGSEGIRDTSCLPDDAERAARQLRQWLGEHAAPARTDMFNANMEGMRALWPCLRKGGR